MNPIVLYYSKSGTTQKFADRICDDFGCKQIFIEPKEAYGNYIASICRVANERKAHIVPAFITEIPNLQEYDTIFLGFPVWYSDIPAFVAAFVRRCDLRGKTVIPFTTFGGKGMKWSKDPLKEICSGARICHPFESGMLKKADYNAWISKIKHDFGG